MRISDSFPLFVCGSFVAHNERGLVGAHESNRGEGVGVGRAEKQQNELRMTVCWRGQGGASVCAVHVLIFARPNGIFSLTNIAKFMANGHKHHTYTNTDTLTSAHLPQLDL